MGECRVWMLLFTVSFLSWFQVVDLVTDVAQTSAEVAEAARRASTVGLLSEMQRASAEGLFNSAQRAMAVGLFSDAQRAMAVELFSDAQSTRATAIDLVHRAQRASDVGLDQDAGNSAAQQPQNARAKDQRQQQSERRSAHAKGDTRYATTVGSYHKSLEREAPLPDSVAKQVLVPKDAPPVRS